MPTTTQLRIEATHRKISEIFSESYIFSIPEYQRPYAWGEEEVKELLEDIKGAMVANEKSESDNFYFLGSIVLAKSHDKPNADIIDGQQRLTTLTILLAVIRDLTKDDKVRWQRNQYIKQDGNQDKGIPESPRLKLRKKDQDFFNDHIQKESATKELSVIEGLKDSNARIVENRTTIHNDLKNMHESELDALIQFLLQKCYLVVVEVPTPSAARRIFTVLNTRGMDLLPTDILKADFLENFGDATGFSDKWEDIEDTLGREKFRDLFTHIRMIHKPEKLRSNLEDRFAEHVPAFKKNPAGFMRDILEPYSKVFKLTQDERQIEERFGFPTANLVRSLNRLNNKNWLPPLLFAFRKSDLGENIDIPQITFKLERLAYYLFITRVYENPRISRYANVLKDIQGQTKKDKKPEAFDLKQDEAFDLFNALNGPIYKVSSIIKPVLFRLEQASTDGSATYDHRVVSVEHVCPQTIQDGSEWATWYPNQEKHDKHVHTLGNLILLNRGKNSGAKNYDFAKKKEIYFPSGNASAFTLTNDVLKYETWKPKDVKKRQLELLKRLAEAWKLEEEFKAWQKEND